MGAVMDVFSLDSLLGGLVLLASGAVAVVALVLALGQSRRIDRLARRQAYETECLVKSIQALEQQNVTLQQRLNAVIGVSQKLADRITKVPVNQEEDQAAGPVLPTRHQLH
jgi:hypothetical protein